jgi:prepilin-type N-terminal cleavage/methylation domain-containing protein
MQKKLLKTLSSNGFTLLEILIIIAIFGILAAIAVPSLLAFIDIQRLNTSQTQIFNAMRQAQSQATREKITWQISFREQNGFVQWAIHQAQAEEFIPGTIAANDQLWQNLEPNIRIDTERNNKNKYETTLPQQTSPLAWRVMFNYQGCPVFKVGNECTQTSLRTLGQITFLSQNGGKARRCVYVSTILGAMRMGKEHDVANDNGKYCY